MTASPRSWRELARSARPGPLPAAERAREYLCFELAGSPYALPVEDVREVARLRPITPLPRARHDLLGVISLRGQVLCVIDPRRRLGLPAAPPARGARIAIVAEPDGASVGLLLDRVLGVLRGSAPPLRPAGAGEPAAVGLIERGGRFVTLLDAAELLGRDA